LPNLFCSISKFKTHLQLLDKQYFSLDVDMVFQFERPYPLYIDQPRLITGQFDVTLNPMQIRTFLLR